MGIINFGIPEELVLLIKNNFNIKNFVETGTYTGKTSVWASTYFDKVITIENSHEIYNKTSSQYNNIKNIEFKFGDSRLILKNIIGELDNTAIFWLDSHWCGGSTFGENDQCPLIEEINSINNSKFDQFILIDDARYFLSPPQQPYNIEQWPSIDEIILALRSNNHQCYTVIFEDVIISVPMVAKKMLSSYCKEKNSKTNKAKKRSVLKSMTSAIRFR